MTDPPPPHFFRSHRSSTLDFHFLSHYSYIKAIMLYKGNHWTHSAGFMDTLGVRLGITHDNFGTSWALPGENLQMTLAKLGKILAYSGILCYTMARLWHTLAYSGTLWHNLAYSGILWHTLAYSDILWHTLAYSCILWHTLAYSSILWHTLA